MRRSSVCQGRGQAMDQTGKPLWQHLPVAWGCGQPFYPQCGALAGTTACRHGWCVRRRARRHVQLPWAGPARLRAAGWTGWAATCPAEAIAASVHVPRPWDECPSGATSSFPSAHEGTGDGCLNFRKLNLGAKPLRARLSSRGDPHQASLRLHPGLPWVQSCSGAPLERRMPFQSIMFVWSLVFSLCLPEWVQNTVFPK